MYKITFFSSLGSLLHYANPYRLDELGKYMDSSRTCTYMCMYIHQSNLSVRVFNISPLLSFTDEVNPRMEVTPQEEKKR